MDKKPIKLLAMDVDGTLTDGKIHISGAGELFKSFHVQDGYGITRILPKIGIRPVIITGRNSEIVTWRAKELGITDVYQGISDKRSTLERIAAQYLLEAQEVAFIGDDMNDAPCFAYAGLTFAPANAVDSLRPLATVMLSHNGGEGAVRECIEYLKEFNEGTRG